jgi:hypothetical protein
MNNLEFLNCISRSFKAFLETSSQSNEKLKIIHGEIAADLLDKLGQPYTVKSLSMNSKSEGQIQGRYINKKVDITILKNDIEIAGIAIKFVMQNYSQNSNNYFETMLGETANIRSKNIPYFQIFIIPGEIPYYKKGGKIKNWETLTTHNIEKYRILSTDNVEILLHTPSKTLLYVIKLPTIANKAVIKNNIDYKTHYQSVQNLEILTTDIDFGTFSSNVIFNDYENFIDKIVHRIKSI